MVKPRSATPEELARQAEQQRIKFHQDVSRYAEQTRIGFSKQQQQRDQALTNRLREQHCEARFRQFLVRTDQEQRTQLQELREAQQRQVQQRDYQKAVGTLAMTHRQFFGPPGDSPGLQPEKQAEPLPRAPEKSNREVIERQASGKLKLGESLAGHGFRDDARQTFTDVIAKYPDTQAAAKARQLLE